MASILPVREFCYDSQNFLYTLRYFKNSTQYTNIGCYQAAFVKDQ